MKAGQRVVRMLPDKGCEGWHGCRVVGLQFREGFEILLTHRRLKHRRRQRLKGAKRFAAPAQHDIADRPPPEVLGRIGDGGTEP